MQSSALPTPALNCEIPFINSTEYVAGGQGFYGRAQGAAGFLKLPDGTFRADPNGALVQGSSAQYRTVASPTLPGDVYGDRWWDGPANRWLPVASSQIAPDGRSYVYGLGPEIHIVTVATASESIVFRQPSGAAPVWLVYRNDGIYLSVNNQYKGTGGSVQTLPADQVGVWRVDPGGAAPQRVLSQPIAGVMGNGTFVWAVDNETLTREDLASTRRDAWFSDQGRGMQILGVDPSGNPVVWTYGQAAGQLQLGLLEIWSVNAPNAATELYSETYAPLPKIYGVNVQEGPLAVDRHGVWFGASTGLYLYDPTGFHKVAEMPGIPVGPCR
jgi:hypothetical protein